MHPDIKVNGMTAELDKEQADSFLTGNFFARYLLVLKRVLSQENQDFNIDDSITEKLKDTNNQQTRMYNWNILCNELDKIAIIVSNEVK